MASLTRAARSRITALRDLATLFGQSRRLFLLPLAIVMTATGVLLAAVQVIEYVAPFVYSLF
jgi:hypothetical protein